MKSVNGMKSGTPEYDGELRRAASALPPGVRRWIGRAIDSGSFPVEAGIYDGGPGGSVCPFVAGAMMAGVWSDGRVLAGNPEWGAPSGPTPEIEDFAAYFDLCAEDSGTAQAIETVRGALVAMYRPRKLAA